MLIITNRQPVAGATDGKAFSSRFTVNSPALSVAKADKLTQGEGAAGWKTSQVDANATDAAIAIRIAEYFAFVNGLGRRVLVYVHGNGYDYLECLERCEAMAAKYTGVEVIGFSWPSEGFAPGSAQALSESARDMGHEDLLIRKRHFHNWLADTKDRYKQACRNAEGSAMALARTLKLINDALALAGNGMSGALSIHSLGNQLFLHALTDHQADENVGSFTNILLLAPCVDARQQDELLNNLNPANGVYVTFNKNDWVLAGAQAADGDTKLGIDPGNDSDLSANFCVRYVDFEGAARGLVGHRYFIDKHDTDVPATMQFFKRTFNGEDDIQAGEQDRDAYPFLCDIHGKVCWMGMAVDDSSPGG